MIPTENTTTSNNVPYRYTGYDKNGNKRTGKNAYDANLQINPKDIETAVETAKENIDEAKKGLKKAIEEFETNAIEAIQIEGVTGFDGIDELKKALEDVPKNLYDLFDETVSKAHTAHDKIQEQYNIEARDYVKDYEGVVKVEKSEINL